MKQTTIVIKNVLSSNNAAFGYLAKNPNEAVFIPKSICEGHRLAAGQAWVADLEENRIDNPKARAKTKWFTIGLKTPEEDDMFPAEVWLIDEDGEQVMSDEPPEEGEVGARYVRIG
jgi:hypothetical protein